jgi:hypothetical protein
LDARNLQAHAREEIETGWNMSKSGNFIHKWLEEAGCTSLRAVKPLGSALKPLQLHQLAKPKGLGQ